MILLVVLTLLLIALCTMYFRSRRNSSPERKMHLNADSVPPVPGDPGILSEIKDLTDFSKGLSEMSQRYRDHGVGWSILGVTPFYTVFGASYMEVMATSPNLQKKMDLYNWLMGFISGGVFSHPGGTEWKELRKPLNKSMVQTYIGNDYFKIFVEKCNELVRYLTKHQDEECSFLEDDIAALTLDIFSRTHLGVETNNLTQRRWQLNRLVATSVPLFYEIIIKFGYRMSWLSRTWKHLFQGEDKQNTINHSKNQKPNFEDAVENKREKGSISKLFDEVKGWASLTLPSWIRRYCLIPYVYMTKDRKKIIEIKKQISQLTEWILEERKKSNVEGINGVEFYLDFIVRRGKENRLSKKEISKELTDILIAGSDTTPVAASSALLFLAMHPEVQEQVYREQVEIFSDSERDPTVQDLAQMELLDRVIKETLRMVCPPGMLRQIEQEDRIGDHIFPKGSIFYMVVQSLHRNPKYWERPHDFYPDHFLPEKVAARPKYAYVPFGLGFRKCPGSLYASTLLKVILSTLLRKFSFTTAKKFEEIEYVYVLMFGIKGGYPIEFKIR